MEDHIKANGSIIRCTAKVCFCLAMENVTRENSLTIRKKAMASYTMLVGKCIKDNGRKESSMGKES